MINDTRLLNFLKERALSSNVSVKPRFVTRRTFLKSVATISLLLPMRSFASLSQPQFRWKGNSVEISMGSLAWIVEPAAFGADAYIKLRRIGDSFALKLVRAIMPGTNLRVDFTLNVYRFSNDWQAMLTMPSLGFAGEISLISWLSGAPIVGRLKPLSFSAGLSQLQFNGRRLSVVAQSVLTLKFDSSVYLTGQVECSSNAAWLAVNPKTNAIVSRVGDFVENGYVTSFTLFNPTLSNRAFSCGRTDGLAVLKPQQAVSVDGEFFESGGQRNQLTTISGPATLELRRGGSTIAPLVFEQANLFVSQTRLGIAGNISRQPFLLPVGGSLAALRGVENNLFSATYGANEPVLIEASLGIERFWTPIPDGDSAEIVVDFQPITLSTKDKQNQGSQSNLLVVGDGSSLILGLDGSVVTLRRGSDLLELQFQFLGFELVRRREGKLYIRRKIDKTNRNYPAAFITVSFPPQHIAEELTNINDLCPDLTPKKIKHRFSQPSRLVFMVAKANHRRDAKWRTRELTVEALTDWSELEPCIQRRAQSNIGDDVKSQLLAVGIDWESAPNSLEKALKLISDSFQLPTKLETSLELASDLIFSPSDKGRWQLPPRAPDNGKPLFGVRIGHQSDPQFRAIWSKLLPECRIPFLTNDDDSPKNLHSISRKNHWGIVAQTSVFGLPALRRLVEPNTSGGSVNEALSKVPRGDVVRPELPGGGTVAYLHNVDECIAGTKFPTPNPESGIALASTFENADITLTSMGAIMRLSWHGEPPVLKPDKYFVNSGISLQKLFYSTWLARDEYVVAVNKGYLFPFGIRASLLTIAERAYVTNSNGRQVAIEILRERIVTGGSLKAYPSLNQPNGGRDFPPTSIRMLTESSPDIVQPDDEASGRIMVPKYDSLKAFWPKVKAEDGSVVDVLWKCQVDDDSTAMILPLIFIESNAAAVPDFVQEVVRLYNLPAEKAALGDEPWPQNNVALLNGTRRRYADSRKDGDTSFDTHSWLLRARGRAAGAGESFIMDARMNGADQPPFYPSVYRAKVTIQSLDRLLEKPAGLVEVKPYERFVRQGFEDENEKAQIFLEIVRPLIKFDVSNQGQKSGGLAQPNAYVAALSRTTGIVGGSRSRSASPLMGKTTNENSAAELQFSSAANGVFSPKEFFNSKLNILGIDLINLVKAVADDAISNAPKLIEHLDYGGMVGDSSMDNIRRYAGDTKTTLEKINVEIKSSIKKIDDELKNANLSFKTLYPDLDATLKSTLPKLVENLEGLEHKISVVGDIPKYATPLLADGRPLIAAIGIVLRNPIPPQVDAAIEALTTTWKDLKSVLEDALKKIAAELLSDVVQTLLDPLLASFAPNEASLLFLLEDGEKLIDLLQDPAAAERIAHTLFVEQFGTPILAMFAKLDDFIHQIDGVVKLARSAIRARVQADILTALNVVANKIDSTSGPAEGNIAQPEGKTVLAAQIINLFDDQLQLLQQDTNDSTKLIKRLNELDDNFEAGLEAKVQKVVYAAAPLFHPLSGYDVDQIVAEFTSAIVKPLADGAVELVRERRDVVLARVLQLSSDAQKVIVRGAEIISVLFNCGIAIKDFVRIGDLVPKEWCSKANGIIAVATALGDSLLGDENALVKALSLITQKTNAIVLPSSTPAHVIKAFLSAKQALGSANQQLSNAITELMAARARLKAFTQPSCPIDLDFTRTVGDCIRLRQAALAPLLAVARGVTEVEQVLEKVKYALPDEIRLAVCSLISDLTLLARAGKIPEWTIVNDAVAYLTNNVGDAEFVSQLAKLHNQIVNTADSLRSELVIIKVSDLPSFVDVTLQTLVRADKQLVALIMQTVALSPLRRQNLENVALNLMCSTASVMGAFHNSATTPLIEVLKLVKNDYLVVQFLISSPAFDKFEKAVLAAGLDTNSLVKIERAKNDPITAYSETKALVNRWSYGSPPLVSAILEMANFVDQIFQGQFEKLIADQVRAPLQKLEENLQSLASQFLPTKLSTGFDWSTNLGNNDNDSFNMSDNAKVPHLKINSNVSYDLISNKRSADIKGELQEFQIKLASLATIFFEPVLFSSTNGATPDFKVKIKSVKLEEALDFISALQSWMSPQGSGFYVQPNLSGIKVGYAFAAGLIQVGTLQFINVAFDVYAELPFTDTPAKFGFLFANRERPFLISNPPYGGGGWLRLTTDVKGTKDIELSFVFGAVTVIKFGPLQGQGRICAGMRIANDSNTGLQTIEAIVEAVGDGNIACFSISIFIRLTLTHVSNGLMRGGATYGFAFRMGFFKFRYKVKATKELQGGSKESKSNLERSKANSAVTSTKEPLETATVVRRTIKSAVPLKSVNWRKYRKLVDMDLLDNAGVFD